MKTSILTKKRNYLQIIALFVFLMTLFLGLHVPSFALNSNYKVEITVEYNQTEARVMLSYINAFRTGSEAWYLNQDNQTRIYVNHLGTLTYDYALEEIAMQRAAEIAIYFSHTRPNNTSTFTTVSSIGTTAWGENLAWGTHLTTSYSAVEAWKETNEDYDGQGHRRNMLVPQYTSVGVAYAYYEGRHYWVQEFGIQSGTSVTNANNSSTVVEVEISSEIIPPQSLSNSIVVSSVVAESDNSNSVYRLYNPYSGEHLFTMSYNEYYLLTNYGWNQEGIAWQSSDATNSPVYRLYNPLSGDHHYTVDTNEYNSLVDFGWNQEGIAWYSEDFSSALQYIAYLIQA